MERIQSALAKARSARDRKLQSGKPAAATDSGPWQGCLTGIGSEWSQPVPGYLAGAVDAAALGVQACLAAARSAAP